MIVKIISTPSSDFHAVQYNHSKVEKEEGELTSMRNFPSFINSDSAPGEVRNYLKSISNNSRVKDPQFHTVISTRFQDHNKEQLTDLAHVFMREMGYQKQPYLVVFHNDTKNNHVHIVSTRIDKTSGRKIKDSFERVKAQSALKVAMKEVLDKSIDKDLEKLLEYDFSSVNQLKTLLEANGYKLRMSKENGSYEVFRNGLCLKKISQTELNFSNSKDLKRQRQIKAILNKYKSIHSNKVFKVEDNRKAEGLFKRKKPITAKPKIEFQSELQFNLKKVFGLEIIFHSAEDKMPFGFTLIDHKDKRIYKGSEISKMNELFEFTQSKIQKRHFEIIKNYSAKSIEERKLIKSELEKVMPGVEDFMLFFKDRKNLNAYRDFRKDVFDNVLKKKSNKDINITQYGDKFYVHHTRLCFFEDLKDVIGESNYQTFKKEQSQIIDSETKKNIGALIDKMFEQTYAPHDNTENELKKRRKKRK